jgi:parallel beta-helix repeat protein
LEQSHDNYINNNTIHGTYCIEARNSNNNIITGNNLRGAQGSVSYCILLVHTSNTLIYDNNFLATFFAFFIGNTKDTTIQKNIINIENGISGVYLDNDVSSSIIDNNIQGDSTNNYGIWLFETKNCYISGNSIKSSLQGILLDKSTGNTITGNTISENIQGIMMKLSKDNLLYRNKIFDNFYGIKLTFSKSNKIYDNIFSNEKNVEVDFLGFFCLNKWNIKKTEGENIIGGPYIGGNFWTGTNGYKGRDKDGDGIGDRWYIIGITGIDFSPLVEK